MGHDTDPTQQESTEYPILTVIRIWILFQVVLISAVTGLSLLSNETLGLWGFGVSYAITILLFALFSILSIICSFSVVNFVTKEPTSPLTIAFIFVSTIIAWAYSPVYIINLGFDPLPIGWFSVLIFFGSLAVLGSIVILIQAVVSTPGLRSSVRSILARKDRARQPAVREEHDVVHRLRRRSRTYRIESRLSVGLILVALMGGAAVFILADAIATINVERQLNSVATRLRNAERAQHAISKEIEELSQRRVGDRDQVSYDDLLEKMTRLDQQLSSMLTYEGSNLATSLQAVSNSRSDDEALRTILSSLSTRIGSVFLVIFLVKILTTLFRYSSRMAAHYESRADVLALGRIPEDEMASFLSTDYIGFDKVPRAPTADVREIVRSTVETLKSNV